MSPRQLIRHREMRAPDVVADDLSEAQLRAYPDDAAADGQDFEQFTNALTSRIRLNARSSDWRRSGLGGGGGETDADRVYEEIPQGEVDNVNQVFTTAYKFHPQTMALYFNGLRQQRGIDSDFVAQESAGQGTGFDTIRLAYAPGERDTLWADYTRDDTAADGQGN